MKKKKRKTPQPFLKANVRRLFDVYGRLESTLLDEAHKLDDRDRGIFRQLHQNLGAHLK